MTSRRKKGAAPPAGTQRGAGRRPGIEPAGAQNPGQPRRVLVRIHRDRRGLWAQVEGPDGQVARAFRGQWTLQRWPEQLDRAAMRFPSIPSSYDPERWWHESYAQECARLWRLAALPIERVGGEAEVTEAEIAAGGRAEVASVSILGERPKKLCACGGYLQARYPSLMNVPQPDGRHCAFCRWNLKHDPTFDPASMWVGGADRCV